MPGLCVPGLCSLTILLIRATEFTTTWRDILAAPLRMIAAMGRRRRAAVAATAG